jgi:tripartite-type tricarboxylate transporter receptor subunit TctC
LARKSSSWNVRPSNALDWRKDLRNLFAICLGALLAFGTPIAARAQDTSTNGVEEFYAGRIVELYIGFAPGGGYDLYGRLVARHIGKHIPGHPTVVPMNMEGAGSLRLMNWLHAAAPKDGTVIGLVNRGTPFAWLLENRDFALFDPRDYFWLGSANDDVSVCVSWERSGIETLEDMREREFIVGSTGPGADENLFPKVLEGVLDANIRNVAGYAGGNDINFAMERGEVDGRCGWTWSSVVSTKPAWLVNHSINVIMQFALRKHPDLHNVPLMLDFAENEQQYQILRLINLRGPFGRPFLAPPDIPHDRAIALRTAFETMLRDPEFLAEAERAHMEINPISADELLELLNEAYATPEQIVDRARAIIN